MNQHDQQSEPVRVAYSLEEIRAKLTPWMVVEFGHPKELDPDERDRWHERNGLIHHFLICHFPDADGRRFGEDTQPNEEAR